MNTTKRSRSIGGGRWPQRTNPIFKSTSEFQKSGVIGTGAFSQVYKAVHIPSKKIYAIKEIELRKLSSADIENIKMEIELQQPIDHPHIIKLHDYLKEGSKVSLILDFADKGTMFRYLDKNHRLPVQIVAKFIRETCLALQYLHQKGIVHRDLKPENLVLMKDLQVKLCDFGWCCRTAEIKHSQVYDDQARKEICGTHEYMAPEILMLEPYDERVDIWAVGILLFELFHNKEPYSGETPRKILEKIKMMPLKFQGHMPRDATSLVQEILSIQKEKRPSFDKILSNRFLNRGTFSKTPRTTSNRRVREHGVSGKGAALPNGHKRRVSGLGVPRINGAPKNNTGGGYYPPHKVQTSKSLKRVPRKSPSMHSFIQRQPKPVNNNRPYGQSNSFILGQPPQKNLNKSRENVGYNRSFMQPASNTYRNNIRVIQGQGQSQGLIRTAKSGGNQVVTQKEVIQKNGKFLKSSKKRIQQDKSLTGYSNPPSRQISVVSRPGVSPDLSKIFTNNYNQNISGNTSYTPPDHKGIAQGSNNTPNKPPSIGMVIQNRGSLRTPTTSITQNNRGSNIVPNLRNINVNNQEVSNMKNRSKSANRVINSAKTFSYRHNPPNSKLMSFNQTSRAIGGAPGKDSIHKILKNITQEQGGASHSFRQPSLGLGGHGIFTQNRPNSFLVNTNRGHSQKQTIGNLSDHRNSNKPPSLINNNIITRPAPITGTSPHNFPKGMHLERTNNLLIKQNSGTKNDSRSSIIKSEHHRGSSLSFQDLRTINSGSGVPTLTKFPSNPQGSINMTMRSRPQSPQLMIQAPSKLQNRNSFITGQDNFMNGQHSTKSGFTTNSTTISNQNLIIPPSSTSNFRQTPQNNTTKVIQAPRFINRISTPSPSPNIHHPIPPSQQGQLSVRSNNSFVIPPPTSTSPQFDLGPPQMTSYQNKVLANGSNILNGNTTRIQNQPPISFGKRTVSQIPSRVPSLTPEHQNRNSRNVAPLQNSYQQSTKFGNSQPPLGLKNRIYSPTLPASGMLSKPELRKTPPKLESLSQKQVIVGNYSKGNSSNYQKQFKSVFQNF